MRGCVICMQTDRDAAPVYIHKAALPSVFPSVTAAVNYQSPPWTFLPRASIEHHHLYAP
jgi:hypothetical protein